MEIKKDLEEKDGRKLPAEWEKPSVKELDINAITLAATGIGADGGVYS
jgi:hypothetical protein